MESSSQLTNSIIFQNGKNPQPDGYYQPDYYHGYYQMLGGYWSQPDGYYHITVDDQWLFKMVTLRWTNIAIENGHL